MSSWSKAWLETAGVNTLRPEYHLDEQERFSSFAVLQEAIAGHPALRPHRIAIGLYDKTDTGLTRRHRIEVDIADQRTEIPGLVGLRRSDLVLVNDDDLSYAKVRLDSRSLSTLISGIGDFTDSLPAALCWAAAWDMCRDAEMAARDYVSLVLSGIASVPDIAVVQTLLRQASITVRRYVDPAWRDHGLALLAATLRRLLLGAEPGSDHQLAYAQALANVATSAEDLQLLTSLLDGTTAIDGLVIDTELRWRLLRRLVSRGAAGTARIDAELDRDRTDAGERHAARCQASIPEPEAKQAAWVQIVSGTLRGATFRAALRGFYDSDQDELLAPYAPKYFEVVADLWQSWGSDMAQYFAGNAYPISVVTPAAISAADDYLARTDPPPGLRRLLAECRDDVARGLRCRQRDAEAS
jgi:aminopeptidase N